MAGILKHWREASTLLICTKRLNRLSRDAAGITRVMEGVKTDENYISKTGMLEKFDVSVKQSDYDYDLLYIERSMKSKFMPCVYVYPGGMADNADFSADWCDLFNKANCDVVKTINDMNDVCQGHPAPLFTRERPTEFSYTPADVAFRIAAIRETFEETGVLLARPYKETLLAAQRFSEFKPNFTSILNLSSDDVCKWREKISSNPAAFMELCKTLNILPDIWSLYEWANWLTPIFEIRQGKLEKKRFRYDTAFYICFAETDESLNPQEDKVEATHTAMLNPFDVILTMFNHSRTFAPPQLYENSRLLACPCFDDLMAFATSRSKYRVDLWMPYLIRYSDGLVKFLPGDELYPSDPDLFGHRDPDIKNESASSLASYSAANRMIQRGNNKPALDIEYNITTHGRHLAPMTQIRLLDMETDKQ